LILTTMTIFIKHNCNRKFWRKFGIQPSFGVICGKPPNSCEFDSNGIRLMAMMREKKKLNFEPLAISYYIYVIFSFLYALCPMHYKL